MSLNCDTNYGRMARGRGVSENITTTQCICERPHRCVLCNSCGFVTEGRVRQSCPVHPKTVFLLDISQCPRCKTHEFMLQEF